MATVFTVTNQKGGVGKTTTSINLAAALNRRGIKTLVIDMDPQKGNLTQTLHGDKNKDTMFEVLCGQTDLPSVIQHTKVCDIAPAKLNLQVLAPTLEKQNSGIGREHKLRQALKKLPADQYDVILVDTAPALDLLASISLTASDYVLVVVEADVNAMHGMKQLSETVEAIKECSNPKLDYAGVLMTKFMGRTNNGKDMDVVAGAIGDEIGAKMFKTHIRHGVSVKDAMTAASDVYSFDKNNNPAIDYEAFAEEFIERMGLKKAE